LYFELKLFKPNEHEMNRGNCNVISQQAKDVYTFIRQLHFVIQSSKYNFVIHLLMENPEY